MACPLMNGSPLHVPDNVPNGLPHLHAALIHVTVRIADHLDVAVKFETSQDDLAGLGHGGLSGVDCLIELIKGSFDEQGIMDRGTDLDTVLRSETTRQAQHLRTVRLHWKIAQRTGVGSPVDMDRPAEHRTQFPVEHGMIECGIGPGPEGRIGFSVQTQELPSLDYWLANPRRQGFFAHAVLHGEDAGLELIALFAMAVLGSVRRHRAGLLSEGEIRVSGEIGLLHSTIAG